MDFSKFFIDRPIFAAVLSIIIFVAGLIALPLLPISEYPDVVPPSVQVRAVYPGANPKEISETVATPLEEAINGVENMMYMKSVAGSDGVLLLTVTFRPGTDPDAAQVSVQNRVSQAQSRLPEAVIRQGVTTQKQSPNFTMVINLFSPDDTYNSLYLRNYGRSEEQYVPALRDKLDRVRIAQIGSLGELGLPNDLALPGVFVNTANPPFWFVDARGGTVRYSNARSSRSSSPRAPAETAASGSTPSCCARTARSSPT